jgi:hypothetical protein
MRKVAVKAALAGILILMVSFGLEARNFALYPGERPSTAGQFVLQDLGGSGPEVLFVEDEASKTNCLCSTAKVSAGKTHAYVVWIPKSATLQDAHEVLAYMVNGLKAASVHLASTIDTCSACQSVAQSLSGKIASVYEAAPDLVANLSPAAIAGKVVAFVAGQEGKARAPGAGSPVERKYREPGWSGWTLE